MDFDWPLDVIWPGFMVSLTDSDINYCTRGTMSTGKALAHFGRLAGMGEYPEFKIYPPEGDGWQLWETVSEGSPISPVFATDVDLARFLVDGGGKPIGDPPTYEEALNFVRVGFAPLFLITATEDGLKTKSGVKAVGEMASSPAEPDG